MINDYRKVRNEEAKSARIKNPVFFLTIQIADLMFDNVMRCANTSAYLFLVIVVF